MTININNLKYANSLIRDEDIINDCPFNNSKYYKFQRIYPFSNENTKGMFSPFDLDGKRILSVQASSDQIFEMFLKGARNFDTFDINPLSKDYYFLKKAAFQALNIEEFTEFFCMNQYINDYTDNYNAFNITSYKKLEPYLENNYLWKNLFEIYNPLQIRAKNRIFNDDEDSIKVLEKTLSYLEPKQYQIVKEHIKEINLKFYQSSVYDIPNMISGYYDFIYLSNIICYAEDVYINSPLEKYKDLVLKLSDHLNPNGIIIVGYLYSIESERTIPIYQKNYREKVFWEPEFSYIYFKPMLNIITDFEEMVNDACLIYTKK